MIPPPHPFPGYKWPSCKTPLLWRKRTIECDRPKGHHGDHERVVDLKTRKAYKMRVLVSWIDHTDKA